MRGTDRVGSRYLSPPGLKCLIPEGMHLRCPNDRDGTVVIEENGQSTVARFSFNMFRFVGDVDESYIHCQVQLCDFQNSNCLPSCPSTRAGGGQKKGTIHTTGPYKKQSDLAGNAAGNLRKTGHGIGVAVLSFIGTLGWMIS
ncbi:uromodulin-like [Pristis pectinata]|uniref:uromodulin-like n=1 Tax=Pristis pectinata TaxID=685728 RepID=UPI00223E0AD6|nr:uromodulin-like [Pristis pectinata]